MFVALPGCVMYNLRFVLFYIQGNAKTDGDLVGFH